MVALVGVLVALVLILAAVSRNTVTKTRTDGDYTAVENVSFSQIDSAVRQNECRFTLGEIGHAETLAFFINHHNVEVYIADECVYTLTANPDDVFSTSGAKWITIPLYPEDTGKEVRAVLTPLYDGYGKEAPEFLVGSEIAIHNVTLHRALPAIMLSFCVIFAGFLLIALAIYHSIKGMNVARLYALGVLAIAAGLWRISYDQVAYLLFGESSVLAYTVSLVSLMALALSMLNTLETSERNTKFVRLGSCAYCVVYIVQLVLQAAGIADIRQSLKLIHITIVISAAAFIAASIIQLVKSEKGKIKLNFGWLLSVGVVTDLLLYYFADTSFKMVFTLVAILCYTVIEGVALMFDYIKQKNALEEMETQLALSRTTTMMSQIRSHFVFNILNAISGMCKYDPEMADDTVVRFARYLRNNIDIMEKDGNIPFATDLRQLEDYFALEQVRFGDKIEFYSDVEVDDFSIPPLILQPVVENAIKHGVSKKQGNGTIILRTRRSDGNVVITVEDDGMGFDMAELEKETSVGIRNIRFRLEHLVHGKMDITSEVGRGTTVTIIIPKENK